MIVPDRAHARVQARGRERERRHRWSLPDMGCLQPLGEQGLCASQIRGWHKVGAVGKWFFTEAGSKPITDIKCLFIRGTYLVTMQVRSRFHHFKLAVRWLAIPAFLVILSGMMHDTFLMTYRPEALGTVPNPLPSDWYCGELFERSRCVLISAQDRFRGQCINLACLLFALPIGFLNVAMFANFGDRNQPARFRFPD